MLIDGLGNNLITLNGEVLLTGKEFYVSGESSGGGAGGNFNMVLWKASRGRRSAVSTSSRIPTPQIPRVDSAAPSTSRRAIRWRSRDGL